MATGDETTAETIGETTVETATAKVPKTAPPSRERSPLRPRLSLQLVASL
jgi:hypothetical protein